MTEHKSIQQLTEEMLARQEAHSAEIARLQEVTRTQLRKVASTLPEVPPMLKEYLAEPKADPTPLDSGTAAGRDDPRGAATGSS